MSPQELSDALKRRPFEPFRIVMTDGQCYDIRHPDLLLVGLRSVHVGLTSEVGQTFFDRTVEVDLLRISRIEPVQNEVHHMSPHELTEIVKRQPFQPFRIVMTDGQGYDIRHPELLMVGVRIAIVGLPGQSGTTLFERHVLVDLLHVIRIEPLQAAAPPSGNGAAGS